MRPDFSVRHLAQADEQEAACRRGCAPPRMAERARSTSTELIGPSSHAVGRRCAGAGRPEAARTRSVSSRSASLARISTKAMPCSTSTDGVGQAQAALQQAAAGGDAAEQDRHRHHASGMCARDEGDQDAGVAVAGDQRGVGRAVHRRHLDRAGQPGAGAAERAGADDQPRRPAGPTAERGARVAAGHAQRRSPSGVQRSHSPGRRGTRRRRAPGPSARPAPASPASMQAVGQRHGRRLVQAGRIAQRASRRSWLNSAMAM